MTEEDAKKKRCCGPCPENTGEWRVVEELPATNGYFACSGSECMAWQATEYNDKSYCGYIK